MALVELGLARLVGLVVAFVRWPSVYPPVPIGTKCRGVFFFGRR